MDQGGLPRDNEEIQLFMEIKNEEVRIDYERARAAGRIQECEFSLSATSAADNSVGLVRLIHMGLPTGASSCRGGQREVRFRTNHT